jgi:hypothetical protein
MKNEENSKYTSTINVCLSNLLTQDILPEPALAVTLEQAQIYFMLFEFSGCIENVMIGNI